MQQTELSPNENAQPLISTRRHAGPNLLLLAIIYLALLIAGASQLNAAFHIPQDPAAAVAAYMAKNGWSIQLGSFFELASAIPLGIFVATTVSRLRFLGITAAGESIAFFGGAGASILLVFSSLATWSITRPGVATANGAVQALHAISFAGAGPGFAVLLGLFLAGVSIPAGLHRLIPRWLMWLGIAVAIACELASFTVLNFTAGYFIPAGRFISILWMIGIALTLPSTLPATAPDRTA